MNLLKNISSLILISAFIILLLLPVFIMVFDGLDKQNNDFPELNLKNPKKSIVSLKRYYTYNFGPKEFLLNKYLYTKNNYFKENPKPNSVIMGKNGWYFLGNQYNNTLNDAFGNDHFTEYELNNITQKIKDINNYLISKNIKFYLVVPPNKNSIYKEELPYKLTNNTNKLTVLKNKLINDLNFKIIDLTDTLLTSKNQAQLYHKTDSHWNDLGSFIGYSKTIKEISKDIEVPLANRSDFNIMTKTINKNDLTSMINYTVNNEATVFESKTEIIPKSNSYNYTHYINPDKSLKLIMHRDSYANAWMKYFVESFGETVFLRDYELDKSLIEKIKPDVIIFELVERDLKILSE